MWFDNCLGHAAALGRTTGLLAAAEDEVSTAITQLFGSYGLEYQAISAQAEAFHAQFAQTLSGARIAYAAAEAANASPCTRSRCGRLGAVVLPAEGVDGTSVVRRWGNGAVGTEQAGGAGGWLLGNGGSDAAGGNGWFGGNGGADGNGGAAAAAEPAHPERPAQTTESRIRPLGP